MWKRCKRVIQSMVRSKKNRLAAVGLLLTLLVVSQLSRAEEKTDVGDRGMSDAFYIAIEPTLVSHFGDANDIAYIKSEVSVRVNNIEAKDFVNLHQPLIRDLLLTNFSVMTHEALNNRDKKEQFQKRLLTILKKELIKEGAQAASIENVLFTRFSVYQ